MKDIVCNIGSTSFKSQFIDMSDERVLARVHIERVGSENARGRFYRGMNELVHEDEKAVLNLLKTKSPIDLNELKTEAGLSNKKWDKAIKGLTKNKLAKVEKTEDGLFVEIV